jgi:hypothetical protein
MIDDLQPNQATLQKNKTNGDKNNGNPSTILKRGQV